MKTKMSKRLLSVLLSALLILSSIPAFAITASADAASAIQAAQQAMSDFENKVSDGKYYKNITAPYRKYVLLQSYIDAYQYGGTHVYTDDDGIDHNYTPTVSDIETLTAELNTATGNMSAVWTINEATVEPGFVGNSSDYGDFSLSESDGITYTYNSQGCKNLLYAPKLNVENAGDNDGTGKLMVDTGNNLEAELWYGTAVMLNDGVTEPGFPAQVLGKKSGSVNRYLFKCYPVTSNSSTDNDPDWNVYGKNGDHLWYGMQKTTWSYKQKDWFGPWEKGGVGKSNGGGLAGISSITLTSSNNSALQCRKTGIGSLGIFQWCTASTIIRYSGELSDYSADVKPDYWYLGYGASSCDTAAYFNGTGTRGCHIYIVNTAPLNNLIKSVYTSNTLSQVANAKENGAATLLAMLDAATAFDAVTYFGSPDSDSAAASATTSTGNRAKVLKNNLDGKTITDNTNSGYVALRAAYDYEGVAGNTNDFGTARQVYNDNNSYDGDIKFTTASYATFKAAYEDAVAIFNGVYDDAMNAYNASAEDADTMFSYLYGASAEAAAAATALEAAYDALSTDPDFTALDEANAALAATLTDNTFSQEKLAEISAAWNAVPYANYDDTQRAACRAKDNDEIADAAVAVNAITASITNDDKIDLDTLNASVTNARAIINSSDPDAWAEIEGAKAALDSLDSLTGSYYGATNTYVMYYYVNGVRTAKDVSCYLSQGGVPALDYIDNNITTPLNNLTPKVYNVKVYDQTGTLLSSETAAYGTTYTASTGDGTEAEWEYTYTSPSAGTTTTKFIGSGESVDFVVQGETTVTRSNINAATTMYAVKYLALPMGKYFKIDYVEEGAEYTPDLSGYPEYPFYEFVSANQTEAFNVTEDKTIVVKYAPTGVKTINITLINLYADSNWTDEKTFSVAYNDLITISDETLSHSQGKWTKNKATADSYSQVLVNGIATEETTWSAANSRAHKTHSGSGDGENLHVYALATVTEEDLDKWYEERGDYTNIADSYIEGKAVDTEKIVAVGDGVAYNFYASQDVYIVIYSESEYDDLVDTSYPVVDENDQPVMVTDETTGEQVQKTTTLYDELFEGVDANGAAAFTQSYPMVVDATKGNLNGGNLQFVSNYYLPEGAEFVEAGFIYNYRSSKTSAEAAEGMLSDTELILGAVNSANYIRRVKATETTYNVDGTVKTKGTITAGNQYVTKINTKNFKGRYFALRYRAYLTYKKNGVLYTTYSDEMADTEYIYTDAEINAM